MLFCVFIIVWCVAQKYINATHSHTDAVQSSFKWVHELLCFICPSYLACHIADFCVVAAVLLGCKQVLTGWLSYGCFPPTYCKCSLLLLFCHPSFSHLPFSSWPTDEWFSKGKLFTTVWRHFASAACCCWCCGRSINNRVAELMGQYVCLSTNMHALFSMWKSSDIPNMHISFLS